MHYCTNEGKDGQLLSAFHTVMRQMSTSSSSVDPSGFLKSLQVVIRAAGNTTYNFNSQQDAAEVLQHVMENMSKDSPIAASTVSTATETTTTCNTCLLSDVSESKTFCIKVPVQNSVQLALSKYLATTESEDFCICCREITPTSHERCITATGTYFIVQQKRFCNEIGMIGKDCTQIECFPENLLVPVGREGEIRNSLPYELVAIINHEGSLSSGHYLAFVKDHSTNKWYNCNDRAVTLS